MKKIDWYILKKFLSTFFFSVILFTMISTVIDMSEKTDDFVKSGLSAQQIFTQYYLGFIPYIIAFLFPLFVFISVIFFTSRMANRSEFIAILASGVSLRRILRPYFIGGLFLSIILWVGNAYLIPVANAKRTAFEAKYTRSVMQESNSAGIYMRMDSFTYAGIRYYDTAGKVGHNFFMNRIKGNQVVYNLRADNISWDNRTKEWKMISVIERDINGLSEKLNYYAEQNKKLPFTPVDLIRDAFFQSSMSTPMLSERINKEKLRGSETVKEFEMEYAHRSATPASVLLLTLIGGILACRKIRGGSGLHLAIGIVICAVFILTDRFSTIFSTKGSLNPYLAAWLPNLIFGGLTWYLYKKAPK